MYLTYPIPIQLLENKLNEFLSEFKHFMQFDYYLTDQECIYVYTFYSLAFAKIAKINSYFFSLVQLIEKCIKKGEVIAIIPLKGYTKMELLFVGKPAIFIIIFPFENQKYSISDKELFCTTMELLYNIIFINKVMEANSLAYAQNLEYENLDNPLTVLKFQSLRLKCFKDFWTQYANDFRGLQLPSNLKSLING